MEQARPVAHELVEAICTCGEQRALFHRFGASPMELAKQVFCAKEAVFKAQSQIYSGYLDFLDVEISIHPRSGRFFVARAKIPAMTRFISGTVIVRQPFVLAAAAWAERADFG